MIINLNKIPSIEFDLLKGGCKVEELRQSVLNYIYESKNSSICKNNKIFLLKCTQYKGLYEVSVGDILGPDIIKSIQNKEIMLGIDCSSEAHYGMVDVAYEIAEELHLPKSQILLITSSTDMESYMKSKYEEHIHLESYDHFEKLAQRQIKSYKFTDHVKPLEYQKKFICLNRMLRDHRVALLHLLYEKDLLRQGYVSCPTVEDYHKFAPALRVKINVHEQMRNLFPKLADRLNYDQQINDMLPMIVDTNQIMEFNLAYGLPENFGLEPYYTTSYFSVVSETYFFNSNPAFITEKIYKPIAYKHPFIISGTYGILKHLRSKGYKTFDGIIDESYDSIEDETERLIAVANEIQRLCSLTPAEVIEFNNRTKEIVDYNQQVLISKKNFIQ